ncbi:MAG: 1-(5-phosphoribosyl)-5-[(5-phosphoribosylamino)methylideneamino]imidazole-4-carboxamide isomerase [Methanoregulaceae archaeon]|jgi:phosphoribosylformimino-5-aminoimidazole carboxamide ribotide isomerase|nr:1-(5-phosphoribosyl)-5-[(5-phosphoribosylamino)methylideneamino]imidazole-4-carboxamide isomerase [Methanoregulaceae archaeon]
MKVFPAVDILDGRCVQLVQGNRETATFFGEPRTCAKKWLSLGADSLHVINLDGAFGNAARNVDLIRELVHETGVTIQLGGGIRSTPDAAGWLEAGVERVILGTVATRTPGIIQELADEFGSARIMAGVDARGREIVIEGWQKTAGDYIHWAERFESLGAGSLLYTNVDVEGLQGGVNFPPVKALLDSVGIPVTVAGGVSSIDDIHGLAKIGVYGTVLGSSLYSGRIRLRDALEAAR